MTSKRAAYLLVSLAALGLVLGLTFGLSGCAASPEPRYSVMRVAGSTHTVVFADGLPLTPNAYRVTPVGSGEALIYNGGRYLGRGAYEEISGKPENLRIEVKPGTDVIVIQE